MLTRQAYSYAQDNLAFVDPAGLDGIFGGACDPWDLSCDLNFDNQNIVQPVARFVSHHTVAAGLVTTQGCAGRRSQEPRQQHLRPTSTASAPCRSLAAIVLLARAGRAPPLSLGAKRSCFGGSLFA